MTRPDDIPEWAWEQAISLLSDLNTTSVASHNPEESVADYERKEDVGVIASALMAAAQQGREAEREACAQVADAECNAILANEPSDPDDDDYNMDLLEEAEYAASIAGGIATAIRARGQS